MHCQLTSRINDFLKEKFPGVTTSTDIFEHALLYFLGCKHVPEKCQYGVDESNTLCVKLRSPYGMPTETFRENLMECVEEYPIEYPIEIETMQPNDSNFVLSLRIPMVLINEKITQIFSSMEYLLKSKERCDYYKYWTDHAQRHHVAFTMVFLESTIKGCLPKVPLSSENEIWSSIITQAAQSDERLELSNTEVLTDFEGWPYLLFQCKDESGKVRLIKLPRHKIIETIETNFSDIKKELEAKKEMILPCNMDQFIPRKFGLREDGKYEIDLAYHTQYADEELLKQYGIQYTSYVPQVEGPRPERGWHYYVFDPYNYIKFCLMLKEKQGVTCKEERLHQLKYYVNEKKWGGLEETLTFLIKMDQIDYADLVFELFEDAKNELSDSYFILEETLLNITKDQSGRFSTQQIQKAHSSLLEIKLTQKNLATTQEEEANLSQEIFHHAYYAKDPIVNHLFAALCGNKFGKLFKSDIINDAPSFLEEVAEEIKLLRTQLADYQCEAKITTPKSANRFSMFTPQLESQPESTQQVAFNQKLV